MARRINPRMVKIHQSYTIEEVAHMLGCSIPTVRSWVKKGLPVLREQIPHLILGADLREYLGQSRKAAKVPLKLNQLYCLKCRKPRVPYGGLVDYIPISDAKGRLEGLCETCECVCNRFVAHRQLPEFTQVFDITQQQLGGA